MPLLLQYASYFVTPSKTEKRRNTLPPSVWLFGCLAVWLFGKRSRGIATNNATKISVQEYRLKGNEVDFRQPAFRGRRLTLPCRITYRSIADVDFWLTASEKVGWLFKAVELNRCAVVGTQSTDAAIFLRHGLHLVEMKRNL